MKHFFGFLFLCSLLVSCTKEDIDTTPSNLPEKEIINVAYGNDPQQKFDIYLPQGRTKNITKVFILIHGGGWTSGDKSDFNGGIPVLKSAYFPDYAIVNINYILGNTATGHYALPDQINDIQKVIDFITSNADEYNIKPEFVLCGHSAGAHLSMYYAYNSKNNPAVKAVISLAGPTDFEDPFYANNIIWQFLLGGLVKPDNIPSGMTMLKYASPVTWITNTSTPTIAFFGSTDSLVPVNEQKTRLDAKFAQVNRPYESYVWNGDHNAYGLEPQLSDVITKSKAFLKKL